MPISPIGRVSYPHVFVKHAYGDNKPRFEITLLWPKDTDLSALEDEVKRAIEEKWGSKAPKKLRRPIKNGDEKGAPEYAGHFCAKFWSKKRPQVVDQKVNTISEDDGKLYAGCYAHVSFSAFTYDRPDNKGVSFGLNHVQKAGDGEPFAGGLSAEEEFDDLDFDPPEDSGDNIFD